MFIQVGRLGESGQGLALGAAGGQKEQLGITSIGIGDKGRAQPHSRNGLGKDQISRGQIYLQILFGKAEVQDAVAFSRVERELVELQAETSGSDGAGRTNSYQEQQEEITRHIISLANLTDGTVEKTRATAAAKTAGP